MLPGRDCLGHRAGWGRHRARFLLRRLLRGHRPMHRLLLREPMGKLLQTGPTLLLMGMRGRTHQSHPSPPSPIGHVPASLPVPASLRVPGERGVRGSVGGALEAAASGVVPAAVVELGSAVGLALVVVVVVGLVSAVALAGWALGAGPVEWARVVRAG